MGIFSLHNHGIAKVILLKGIANKPGRFQFDHLCFLLSNAQFINKMVQKAVFKLNWTIKIVIKTVVQGLLTNL